MMTIRWFPGMAEGGVKCSYKACEGGGELTHLADIRVSNGRHCWHMRHF